jgi:hypothetical protein
LKIENEMVMEENNRLRHLKFTMISDNYQRAGCMKGYLDLITPWVLFGPFLSNTNNLS